MNSLRDVWHTNGMPGKLEPTPQVAAPEGLLQYINLKLAALGQPTSERTANTGLLDIAGPLLRNFYQKDQLLGNRLCPADTRIQAFLDSYLKSAAPAGAPRLPSQTFVLDVGKMARAMSLPPGTIASRRRC